MSTFNWSCGVPLLAVLIIKLFSLLFLVYLFRPTWLIRLWRRYQKRCAGVSEHRLKVDDGLEISYLERKGGIDGEILFLVHGFATNKEVFCDISRLLPGHFHIIMIDLPGHGESIPRDEKSDYSIDTQVENVHKFVKAFGFGEKKFNMIGTSMGGHIVGVYAARYGKMLSSAVLVCPAGINSPQRTQFIVKSLKYHETNALLPRTVDEMQGMLKLVLYHDVRVPYHILRGFIELGKERRLLYKKVLQDIGASEQISLLDGVLENILVPVLCVWGKHDEVLHVSGSDVIKKRVKNAEVHVVERCGHAVLIDRPRKFIKILLEFLEKKTI